MIDYTAERLTSVSPARRTWTVAAMCLILLPVIAPVTGISVAGPDMSASTGASQTEVTWIVDAYTLGLAVALLPAGALGDRFGRRGVMQVGLVLYVLTALPPLFVDSPTWLIALRLLAGLAAGIAMPSTLSIITSIYPKGGRDRAVGVWAGFVVVNSAVGITTFGALTQYVDWRAVFWLAFAMGVFGLLVSFTVPTSELERPPPFDLHGAIASVGAVGITVYALIEAPQRGWDSPLTLLMLAVGLALFAVFVVVELRADAPLLDVRLFTIPAFGVSSLALLAQFVILFGSFYLIVLYVQYVLGYGPFKAGLAITPMALTILPLTVFANLRWGLTRVLVGGCLLSACSLVALMWTDVDAGYGVVLIAVLFIGAGAGISTGPATAAVVDNVSEEKQGVASAVNHTTREVGTALGFAFFGSMLSSGYGRSIENGTAELPEPARSASRDSVVAALQVAEQSGPNGAVLARDAQAAFVTGVHQAAIAGIALMVVSAVLIYVFSPTRPRKRRQAGVDSPGAALEGIVATCADGVVRGTVRDPSGSALLGAAVLLTDLSGKQLGRTMTNSLGEFVIPTPRGRGLLVSLVDGYEPYIENVDLADSPTCQQIVLSRTGAFPGCHPQMARINGQRSVTGTLRAAESATAVPGATVYLVDPSGEVVRSAVTGADGGYRFDAVAPGEYRLRVDVSRPHRTMIDIPASNGRSLVIDLSEPTEHADVQSSEMPR